nr:putative integron gene cassette protein [uncultured bacterium]
MTNRDLAMEYLKCFCAGDIDGLEPLLAANLRFTGTFNTYSSAMEYLDSLRSDPPDKCGYKIISVTENEESVAVFYEYQKLESVVQIAQLFKTKDQKIDDVLLVFDGRGFG